MRYRVIEVTFALLRGVNRSQKRRVRGCSARVARLDCLERRRKGENLGPGAVQRTHAGYTYGAPRYPFAKRFPPAARRDGRHSSDDGVAAADSSEGRNPDRGIRRTVRTTAHLQIEPDDARWTSKPRLGQLATERVGPTCKGVLDHALVFDGPDT